MADYHPPPFPYESHISHYYGDQVRVLFVVAAGLMLIGAPWYANSLRTELPFEITGALILVALAALINPHKKSLILATAVAAGVGAVVYETWALYEYFDSTWTEFILRQTIASVFLFSFYFSMKTVRAFALHQVGKHDEAGEFDEPTSGREKKVGDGEFMPWFFKKTTKKKKEEPETGPRMTPGRSPEEIKPKYHPYEETM